MWSRAPWADCFHFPETHSNTIKHYTWMAWCSWHMFTMLRSFYTCIFYTEWRQNTVLTTAISTNASHCKQIANVFFTNGLIPEPAAFCIFILSIHTWTQGPMLTYYLKGPFPVQLIIYNYILGTFFFTFQSMHAPPPPPKAKITSVWRVRPLLLPFWSKMSKVVFSEGIPLCVKLKWQSTNSSPSCKWCWC